MNGCVLIKKYSIAASLDSQMGVLGQSLSSVEATRCNYCVLSAGNVTLTMYTCF